MERERETRGEERREKNTNNNKISQILQVLFVFILHCWLKMKKFKEKIKSKAVILFFEYGIRC
jgi:hypothetical protein